MKISLFGVSILRGIVYTDILHYTFSIFHYSEQSHQRCDKSEFDGLLQG